MADNKADKKAADAKEAERQARDADAAKQIKKLGRQIGLGKKGKS
jgi:hypothetical protein